MNEAETRAEHIAPALKAAGWGVVEGSAARREFRITEGRLQGGGVRARPEIADYVLVYRNTRLAVIEAKARDKPHTEGVAQAKSYAGKLAVRHSYSTNGRPLTASTWPRASKVACVAFVLVWLRPATAPAAARHASAWQYVPPRGRRQSISFRC